MSTTAPVRPRLRLSTRGVTVAAALLLGGAITALAAESQPATAAATAPTPVASPASAAPAASPAASPTSEPAPAATPEQHDWKVGTDGRRFYLGTYSKSMKYLRLDDKQIRTQWGIPIIVDHEDDQNFYYRIYESTTGTGPTPPGRRMVTDEMRKSYEVAVPVVDRLAFEPFEDGLPTAGQWRNNFTLADMNGDGHLDIVHA